MALRDLTEFFDPTFDLPIGGKIYRVKSPDAATGLLAQRTLVNGMKVAAGEDLTPEDAASLELSDEQERDLYPRLLGDVYKEMVKDKLSWEMVKHSALTIYVWVGYNREAAEGFWENVAPGEAPRPTPQDHKVSAKKTAAKKAASPASRGSSNARTAAAKKTTATRSRT